MESSTKHTCWQLNWPK
jgi:hypothetical protein